MKVRAQISFYSDEVGVQIRDGEGRICKMMEFAEADPGSSTADRTSFWMETHDAQVLMDDLWASGLRPTEGKGSAGQLKATENHLHDMRTIAFDFIGRTKGGKDADDQLG